LKLKPTFVPRFYRDCDRLGQKTLRTRRAPNVPERWIGSSVEAINPPPLPKGGLSMLADLPTLSLRDAIKAAPREMIGEELLARHGAEFRVLVKLLDPGEAIPFHIHATDAQVKRMPKHFRGHRFGKDEAYYFPRVEPKGPLPYSHVGLYPGVSKRELFDAVKKGRDGALEFSPVLYQEYETGFFLPAGVPHSPGTALTLEIQQPSDVYTLLETRAAGKEMSPQQIHPGFKSLEEAFELIDFKLSEKVGRIEYNRLVPSVIRSDRAGEIAWIFPPDICRKFGGKRIRVKTWMTLQEPGPASMLIWSGRGTLNHSVIRAGDELFVTADAMRNRLKVENVGDERLEIFLFFAGS
jgi:hypothetical protein